MRLFLVLTLAPTLLLTACAGGELVNGGERVRIVTASPAGCEYLAEVEGRYQGGVIPAGLWTNKTQAAQIDLKNQVAARGGDAVEVLRSSPEWMMGEAYRCEKRASASK